MIVVPYADDEIRSPQLQLKLFHQPLSPEIYTSMRLGAMLRWYHWDETWMGLLPARIGHTRSLDLAVSAYLEPQKLNSVENSIAGLDSMQLYTEAIYAVQTTMNEPSFWTSEDVQLTVGVLSAYESIKGASMAYMYISRQCVHLTPLSLSQVRPSTRPYYTAGTQQPHDGSSPCNDIRRDRRFIHLRHRTGHSISV